MDGSALSALAENRLSAGSATATAVHNCRYRPYLARQARADSSLLTAFWRRDMHAQGLVHLKFE